MISRCKITVKSTRAQSPIHGISHTLDMVYVNEKPLIRPTLGISAAITNRHFDLLFRLYTSHITLSVHYKVPIPLPSAGISDGDDGETWVTADGCTSLL